MYGRIFEIREIKPEWNSEEYLMQSPSSLINIDPAAALFSNLIAYAEIGPEKAVLEIGPGTGQATAPILETGCDYNAIELGEHLYEGMKHKHGQISQFLHRKR